MASYTLSREADADITDIARASIRQWGSIRAEHYIRALHDAFERLAQFPGLGRDASDIRPGYLRAETAQHVVFYRRTASAILIVRVLHHRMLPGNQFPPQ